MKKVALIFALTLFAGMAIAQNSNVRKAERALEDGELQEAEQLINEAAAHERTKDDGKTWYVRGSIYQAKLNKEFSTEALQEATKSFNKVLELESEGSNYYTLTDLKIQELWGRFINKGSEAYNQKDFDAAIDAFEKALVVLPEDTTATLYAGIAAQQSKQNDKALKFYYRLIDLDYHSEDIYNSIISIERYENEDMEKALEVANMAQEQFPDNDTFEKQEINILIKSDRVDEAKDRLNEAIEKDPENANLYFNLGYLYEELEQPEKAEEAYLKAIEIEPNDFNTNFNYAIMKYNKAADLLGQARDMDLQTYRKKGKKLENEAAEYLKEALPYFEKALENVPNPTNELTVVETLETLYSQLKKNDKALEMRKRAEELKAKSGQQQQPAKEGQ